MRSISLIVLAVFVCGISAQNQTKASKEVSALVASISARQIMSEKVGDLALNLQAAWGLHAFSSGISKLFLMRQQAKQGLSSAPLPAAAIDYNSDYDSDDDDEEDLLIDGPPMGGRRSGIFDAEQDLEEVGYGSFGNPSASPYGSFGANPSAYPAGSFGAQQPYPAGSFGANPGANPAGSFGFPGLNQAYGGAYSAGIPGSFGANPGAGSFGAPGANPAGSFGYPAANPAGSFGANPAGSFGFPGAVPGLGSFGGQQQAYGAQQMPFGLPNIPVATPFTSAPRPNVPEDPKQIEKSMFYSLMAAQKALNIINIHEVELVGRSHNENLVTAMLLEQMASNPAAAQVLYLIQYKDLIDSLATTAALVRQDAITTWNYNEIIKFEFDVIPESFRRVLTASKAIAMEAWFMEAQIDIIDMYLESSLQTLASALTTGLPVTATSGSFPTDSSSGSVPGLGSLLEVETKQSSIPAVSSPDVLSYLNSLKVLSRYLDYAAAAAFMSETKIDRFLANPEAAGTVDAAALDNARKMKEYAHSTAVSLFYPFTAVRLFIATTEATLFAVTIGTGSFGSIGGTSFDGSLGSTTAPLATAAALGTAGSLVASKGSLIGANLIQEGAETHPAIAIQEVATDAHPSLLG